MNLLQRLIITVVALGEYFLERLCRVIFGPPIYSEESVEGKVAVVTGSNTGIGKEVATQLAGRGATVVLACRNLVEGRKAQEDIIRRSKALPGQVVSDVEFHCNLTYGCYSLLRLWDELYQSFMHRILSVWTWEIYHQFDNVQLQLLKNTHKSTYLSIMLASTIAVPWRRQRMDSKATWGWIIWDISSWRSCSLTISSGLHLAGEKRKHIFSSWSTQM